MPQKHVFYTASRGQSVKKQNDFPKNPVKCALEVDEPLARAE
jgi:hypothetical protein